MPYQSPTDWRLVEPQALDRPHRTILDRCGLGDTHDARSHRRKRDRRRPAAALTLRRPARSMTSRQWIPRHGRPVGTFASAGLLSRRRSAENRTESRSASRAQAGRSESTCPAAAARRSSNACNRARRPRARNYGSPSPTTSHQESITAAATVPVRRASTGSFGRSSRLEPGPRRRR